MQILRARPLATATLLAISASVLSFFLGPIGKMVLLMSSLLALLALILLYLLTARRGLRFSNPGTALMMSILICMMTSVTVFASWYHFHPASNIPREIIDDNTTHDVSFCIVEEGNAGIGYTYYTVSLRSIEPYEAEQLLSVFIPLRIMLVTFCRRRYLLYRLKTIMIQIICTTRFQMESERFYHTKPTPL